ncbi:MAG: hypothetical protein IKQ83_04275 [Lachnospiraceae bacterium]|nr:hypothetical protein [Lachnospiraceae bacterium]
MIIAKQMDIRSNIKDFFDKAYEGEDIVVPRKQGKNVVIISEDKYKSLNQNKHIEAYAGAIAKQYKESSSVVPMTDVKSDNLKKLKNIAELRENWNGNGAKPFSGSLIKKVRSLLEALPIQPEVFPTALQTIQLEFDNARHDHMEIEIDESDEADIFIVTYFGEETEETIHGDIKTISERVMKFYG